MCFINEYRKRQEAINKAFANYREGNEQQPGYLAILTQASIAWALLDIAETLGNIQQNGVQVETFASARQPFL